jgi:hypothetical protein
MTAFAESRAAFRNARPLAWFALGLLLLVGLLSLVGVRKPGITVLGTVKVDGEPLINGSILCVPVDDQGAVAEGRGPGGGAIIKDGKYQIDKGLTAGRYQVKIQGTRHLPGRNTLDHVMSYRRIAEEVPVVQTTLVKEVTTGSNTIDFDLVGLGGKGARAGK